MRHRDQRPHSRRRRRRTESRARAHRARTRELRRARSRRRSRGARARSRARRPISSCSTSIFRRWAVSTCSRSCASRTRVPVIMVTGRDGETDRVLGLELGADDYVVKPFSPRELASRVRAILRRSSPATQRGAPRLRRAAHRSHQPRGEGRRPPGRPDDTRVRAARVPRRRRPGGCTRVRNCSSECGRRRSTGRIRRR